MWMTTYIIYIYELNKIIRPWVQPSGHGNERVEAWSQVRNPGATPSFLLQCIYSRESPTLVEGATTRSRLIGWAVGWKFSRGTP
ncbi:hypothetical protein Hanom_Chr15g01372681 [Helianthus anomalus]